VRLAGWLAQHTVRAALAYRLRDGEGVEALVVLHGRVRTRAEQHPHHVEVAEAAGVPQRRPTALIGAVEQLDDVLARALVGPREGDVLPDEVLHDLRVALHGRVLCRVQRKRSERNSASTRSNATRCARRRAAHLQRGVTPRIRVHEVRPILQRRPVTRSVFTRSIWRPQSFSCAPLDGGEAARAGGGKVCALDTLEVAS
jgi:hypothetical protein